MLSSINLSLEQARARIDRLLRFHTELRPINRRQFTALARLERQIFPAFDALFDDRCLRRAKRYFPYSVLVGAVHGEISSYVSVFPMGERAFRTCISGKSRGICELPVEMFRIHREPIIALFFEVIAISEDCSESLRFATKAFSLALLREFRFLPVISFPVTAAGLQILRRLDFIPVREEGLNQLYMRKPKLGGEDG